MSFETLMNNFEFNSKLTKGIDKSFEQSFYSNSEHNHSTSILEMDNTYDAGALL